MVVIRLTRKGTNKRPFYHIVVADRRKACGGRFIEKLGFLNPIAILGEPRLQLDIERVNYWLSVGAKPSPRILDLIKEYQTPKETLEKNRVKKVKRNAIKKAKKVAEKTAKDTAITNAIEEKTAAEKESAGNP